MQILITTPETNVVFCTGYFVPSIRKHFPSYLQVHAATGRSTEYRFVRPFSFLMSLIALCLTVFSAVTVRFKNVNTNIKNSEYVAGKLRNLVFTNDKE